MGAYGFYKLVRLLPQRPQMNFQGLLIIDGLLQVILRVSGGLSYLGPNKNAPDYTIENP